MVHNFTHLNVRNVSLSYKKKKKRIEQEPTSVMPSKKNHAMSNETLSRFIFVISDGDNLEKVAAVDTHHTQHGDPLYNYSVPLR